ncbi:hypothetical protein CRG98_043188 [Punica granatum]|uniref:Uncharacterized protein n=1 Tax=Punica granatum TaxID=22663 RepID=A0A2I0HYR6_PUNGR|nr:hypothetical protein CRG98_043188 [Punica granatum]
MAIRSSDLHEAEVRTEKEAIGKCLGGKRVMEKDDSDTSNSGEGRTRARVKPSAAKQKKRKLKEITESSPFDEDPVLLCASVPTHASSVANPNLPVNPYHPKNSTFPINMNSVLNPAFYMNPNIYMTLSYQNQVLFLVPGQQETSLVIHGLG